MVKKCYRVQVGAYKLGLMSKCMSKKKAETTRNRISQGWLIGEVITGAEAAKRKKRFPKK